MKTKKKKPVGRPKLPDQLVKKKRYLRVSDLDMNIISSLTGWSLQEFVDHYILDLVALENERCALIGSGK